MELLKLLKAVRIICRGRKYSVYLIREDKTGEIVVGAGIGYHRPVYLEQKNVQRVEIRIIKGTFLVNYFLDNLKEPIRVEYIFRTERAAKRAIRKYYSYQVFKDKEEEEHDI